VLFRGQMPGVAKVIGHVKLHKGNAHDGTPLRLACLDWCGYIRIGVGPPLADVTGGLETTAK
jgi:hypothetical protein